MTNNGIFCLEGEWEQDLRDRKSILPVLELLERLGEVKFIHRDVGTRGEAERYLGKWRQKRYGDYQVLCLLTHGDKGEVWWSSERGPQSVTTLTDLASLVREVGRSTYLYLGGCLTLFDDHEVERFIEESDVDAVIGYRKIVDWLDAAAFEIPLLSRMANHNGYPHTFFERLMKDHGQQAEHLKLVVGTPTGVLRAQDWTA